MLIPFFIGSAVSHIIFMIIATSLSAKILSDTVNDLHRLNSLTKDQSGNDVGSQAPTTSSMQALTSSSTPSFTTTTTRRGNDVSLLSSVSISSAPTSAHSPKHHGSHKGGEKSCTSYAVWQEPFNIPYDVFTSFDEKFSSIFGEFQSSYHGLFTSLEGQRVSSNSYSAPANRGLHRRNFPMLVASPSKPHQDFLASATQAPKSRDDTRAFSAKPSADRPLLLAPQQYNATKAHLHAIIGLYATLLALYATQILSMPFMFLLYNKKKHEDLAFAHQRRSKPADLIQGERTFSCIRTFCYAAIAATIVLLAIGIATFALQARFFGIIHDPISAAAITFWCLSVLFGVTLCAMLWQTVYKSITHDNADKGQKIESERSEAQEIVDRVNLFHQQQQQQQQRQRQQQLQQQQQLSFTETPKEAHARKIAKDKKRRRKPVDDQTSFQQQQVSDGISSLLQDDQDNAHTVTHNPQPDIENRRQEDDGHSSPQFLAHRRLENYIHVIS